MVRSCRCRSHRAASDGALAEAVDQLLNRLRLVAGGLGNRTRLESRTSSSPRTPVLRGDYILLFTFCPMDKRWKQSWVGFNFLGKYLCGWEAASRGDARRNRSRAALKTCQVSENLSVSSTAITSALICVPFIKAEPAAITRPARPGCWSGSPRRRALLRSGPISVTPTTIVAHQHHHVDYHPTAYGRGTAATDTWTPAAHPACPAAPGTGTISTTPGRASACKPGERLYTPPITTPYSGVSATRPSSRATGATQSEGKPPDPAVGRLVDRQRVRQLLQAPARASDHDHQARRNRPGRQGLDPQHRSGDPGVQHRPRRLLDDAVMARGR